MKMKYMEVPKYEEVEIAAKTVNSICGTIDRKSIGRTLITEDAGFAGKHQVVDGDGTTIATVEKVPEDGVEVFVEFVGGVKSLASKRFYKGWKAPNKENADVDDVYVITEEACKVDELARMASAMSDAHPECAGQFKFVAGGKRVFLRLVATELDAKGRVEA